MPTKIGFVVTRTTLLATDVNFKELIQKKKCKDKKRPPTNPRIKCLFLKLKNLTPLNFATIRRIIAEMVSRYVAIIIEGTSLQNFTKIDAKDIATMLMKRNMVTLNNTYDPFILCLTFFI